MRHLTPNDKRPNVFAMLGRVLSREARLPSTRPPWQRPTTSPFEATKATLKAHAHRPPDPDIGINIQPRILEVQESLVADLIRKSKLGVSPGIIGWRNEHLKSLAALPHVLTGLTRLIAVRAGGSTPPV